MTPKEQAEYLVADIAMHDNQDSWEEMTAKIAKALRQFYERGRKAGLEEAARITDRRDQSAWGIAHEIRALIEKGGE